MSEKAIPIGEHIDTAEEAVDVPITNEDEPTLPEEETLITPDDYVICSGEAIAYSEGLKCIDALKLLMGGILFTIQQTHAIALAEKPEEADRVKRELYDLVNIGASNVLGVFAPELELRPDLTEEAILKAENEILDNMDEETTEE